MAVHNILLMFLLRLGTPGIVVRALQSWKEGILLLLLAMTVRVGLTARRAGWRPRLRRMDWLMLAFTIIVLVYFMLPAGLLGGQVTLSQRLLGMRVLLLLPLLYLFGRVFWDARRADPSLECQRDCGRGRLRRPHRVHRAVVDPHAGMARPGRQPAVSLAGFQICGAAGAAGELFPARRPWPLPSPHGVHLRQPTADRVHRPPGGAPRGGPAATPGALGTFADRSDRGPGPRDRRDALQRHPAGTHPVGRRDRPPRPSSGGGAG